MSEKVYRAEVANEKYLEAFEMRQAIKVADAVTVEFGTADTPLYKDRAKVFNESNLYVGVNVDPAQHTFLREDVQQVNGHATLAKINKEGGVDTLLPDESVDTVVMANVFGEPDSENIGLGYTFPTDSNKYGGHSAIESKTQTLHEARRVLKQDGKIVILETNTPYKDFSNRPSGWRRKLIYDDMVQLLESSGYAVRDAIAIEDEGWAEIVGQFATSNEGWDDRNSYLVVAEKRLEQ